MSKRGADMLTALGYKKPTDLDGENVLAIWKQEEGKHDDEGKLLLLNSLRIVSDYLNRSGRGAAKRKAFVRDLYKCPGITELTAVAIYESGIQSAKTFGRNLKVLDVNKLFDDICCRKHLSLPEATEIYFSLLAANYMANLDMDKARLANPGPWGKIDGP